MPPSSTLARASRPLFSSTSAAFQTRQAFQRASPFRSAYRRQEWSRRWQSTAGGGAAEGPQVSWFKRMWDSPIGIKTVHFWAPVMKVCDEIPICYMIPLPPEHRSLSLPAPPLPSLRLPSVHQKFARPVLLLFVHNTRDHRC